MVSVQTNSVAFHLNLSLTLTSNKYIGFLIFWEIGTASGHSSFVYLPLQTHLTNEWSECYHVVVILVCSIFFFFFVDEKKPRGNRNSSSDTDKNPSRLTKFSEIFGISGIEGEWDSVTCNGHRPILGPRRGLITHVHQSHSQPFGLSNGLADRHSIYAAHLLPATQLLNPIWNLQSRLPFTSNCSLLLLGMLVSLFLDYPSTFPSREANTPWQIRPT